MGKRNTAELLLIEDNPNEVEFMLSTFKGKNLTNKVAVAKDGAEALDYIFCTGNYKRRNINNTPKLIVLDLKIPKVDGLEVIRRIKSDERTKSIPVVVISDSEARNDVMESYNLGVNSYIVKAVKFEKLLESITEVGKYWLLLNKPS